MEAALYMALSRCLTHYSFPVTPQRLPLLSISESQSSPAPPGHPPPLLRHPAPSSASGAAPLRKVAAAAVCAQQGPDRQEKQKRWRTCRQRGAGKMRSSNSRRVHLTFNVIHHLVYTIVCFCLVACTVVKYCKHFSTFVNVISLHFTSRIPI